MCVCECVCCLAASILVWDWDYLRGVGYSYDEYGALLVSVNSKCVCVEHYRGICIILSSTTHSLVPPSEELLRVPSVSTVAGAGTGTRLQPRIHFIFFSSMLQGECSHTAAILKGMH